MRCILVVFLLYQRVHPARFFVLFYFIVAVPSSVQPLCLRSREANIGVYVRAPTNPSRGALVSNMRDGLACLPQRLVSCATCRWS